MAVKRIFQVNGKPFFPLGGQTHNSSGYNRAELETAWKALEALQANTIEVPVYWEQIEAEEGNFQFEAVEDILAGANEHQMKVILLWFATWKNGMMKYAPGWVKADRQRFQRVIGPLGEEIAVLSSHCAATLEADRKAFHALLGYLSEHDRERAVIAIQVENEPGILGSDRDYGPMGETEYARAIPNELASRLENGASPALQALWEQNGRRQGSWQDAFGTRGGEMMTAWSIARFIDEVAAGGKQVYDLPMYANAWLEWGNWRQAGLNYPSGGAVSAALDLWRSAAPHLDLVAPDIYIGALNDYRQACEAYTQVGNPLFVPESSNGDEGNPRNLFRAIAEYDAIGYAVFGVESMLDAEGGVRENSREVVESFHAVRAALPLLLELQGSGRIHAVVQEDLQYEQLIDLGEYWGLAQFNPGSRMDYEHNAVKTHGRGLVIQRGEHEFYAGGAGFRLVLRKKRSSLFNAAMSNAVEGFQTRLLNYVAVEEGTFDEEGRWRVKRRRNGDESDFGVWVTPDVGLVRVVIGE